MYIGKMKTEPEKMRNMAAKTTVRGGKWVAVQCAYCGGRGKDPFGIPHPKSNCAVCGGRGTVRVQEPYVPCALCRGTGKQAMRRLTCTACKGKGVVTVPERRQTCPACGGTGRAKIEYDLPCTTCSGKGVVAAQ